MSNKTIYVPGCTLRIETWKTQLLCENSYFLTTTKCPDTKSLVFQNWLNTSCVVLALNNRTYRICWFLSVNLPVGFRVEGSLSEEDWVLFWGNAKLIVEGVMPDLLHIIPVGNNSVLNGVFQGKDTSLALGLISYIAVFLTHTYHDTLWKREICAVNIRLQYKLNNT